MVKNPSDAFQIPHPAIPVLVPLPEVFRVHTAHLEKRIPGFICVIIGFYNSGSFFLVLNPEIGSDTLQNLWEVHLGVQSLQLAVEMEKVPLFSASMTEIKPILAVKIQRWFTVIMKRTKSLVFVAAKVFNAGKIFFVKYPVIAPEMIFNPLFHRCADHSAGV
ncbi:conserved hypothetical protein [delta proteobacterium NaphS2]|nr:conserved hypothetical protein [delta proteobacterium NaphS2]